MLKILQARLQQYLNCELPDVQAGFRKCRRTRVQIANIHWIIKKTKKGNAHENRAKEGPRTGVRISGKTNSLPG